MPRFTPAGYLPVRLAVARWATIAGLPFPFFPPQYRDLSRSEQAAIRRGWEAASGPLQQELHAGRLQAFDQTRDGYLLPLPAT